jgi:hypothetical protein
MAAGFSPKGELLSIGHANKLIIFSLNRTENLPIALATHNRNNQSNRILQVWAIEISRLGTEETLKTWDPPERPIGGYQGILKVLKKLAEGLSQEANLVSLAV